MSCVDRDLTARHCTTNRQQTTAGQISTPVTMARPSPGEDIIYVEIVQENSGSIPGTCSLHLYAMDLAGPADVAVCVAAAAAEAAGAVAAEAAARSPVRYRGHPLDAPGVLEVSERGPGWACWSPARLRGDSSGLVLCIHSLQQYLSRHDMC